MRTLLRYSLIILLLSGFIIILHSCKKEELPTLSTASITNISATTATSGGNITDDGGTVITARGICWSINGNPSIIDSKTNDGTGQGQFVSNLSELSAGSSYHVRAYATNSVGTAYGADMLFSTLGGVPECLTQPATDISATGVTLNGTVNANDLLTTVTFEYGLTTSYGQTVTSAQSPVTGNSITNVSADISGLTPGTTYHYRVVAVNSIGTSNGNDLTFTTAAVLPVVTTTPVSNRTATSVTTGGNITSDGGSAISAKGICWATRPNPTIEGSHTLDGSGGGSYMTNIQCLDFATTYYIRAYAINSVGTSYGEELSFTTTGTNPIVFNPNITYGSVTDVDGNCYKTVQIGYQTWMAENLRTTKLNDNTPIPYDPEWIYGINNGYCWVNNDELTNKYSYGALYLYIDDKLCPVGWHVPTENEWGVLFEYLGGENVAGAKLKEVGTNHWSFPNTGATNESGFTALPAGYRYGDLPLNVTGIFDDKGIIAWWWCVNRDMSPMILLDNSIRSYGNPMFLDKPGLSVRCIRDN